MGTPHNEIDLALFPHAVQRTIKSSLAGGHPVVITEAGEVIGTITGHPHTTPDAPDAPAGGGTRHNEFYGHNG